MPRRLPNLRVATLLVAAALLACLGAVMASERVEVDVAMRTRTITVNADVPVRSLPDYPGGRIADGDAAPLLTALPARRELPATRGRLMVTFSYDQLVTYGLANDTLYPGTVPAGTLLKDCRHLNRCPVDARRYHTLKPAHVRTECLGSSFISVGMCSAPVPVMADVAQADAFDTGRDFRTDYRMRLAEGGTRSLTVDVATGPQPGSYDRDGLPVRHVVTSADLSSVVSALRTRLLSRLRPPETLVGERISVLETHADGTQVVGYQGFVAARAAFARQALLSLSAATPSGQRLLTSSLRLVRLTALPSPTSSYPSAPGYLTVAATAQVADVDEGQLAQLVAGTRPSHLSSLLAHHHVQVVLLRRRFGWSPLLPPRERITVQLAH